MGPLGPLCYFHSTDEEELRDDRAKNFEPFSEDFVTLCEGHEQIKGHTNISTHFTEITEDFRTI